MTNSEQKRTLDVSLITLLDRTLILPAHAIVEVTQLAMPQVVAKMPRWFLGYLPWQGLRIPFISFETMTGATYNISADSKIVVLKAVTPDLTTPFIALLIKNMPVNLSITQDNMSDIIEDLSSFEQAAIRITKDTTDVPVRIPNINAIEQLMITTGVLK